MGQFSATKQAEFAVRAAAAASNPLELALVRLEARHASLQRQVASFIRTGQQVPPELLKQAGAAREAAERMKMVSSAAQGTLGQVGRLASGFGKFGLAAVGVGVALKGIDMALKQVDVSAEALADGVSKLERLAFANNMGEEAGQLADEMTRGLRSIPVFGDAAAEAVGLMTRLGVTLYADATNQAEKQAEILGWIQKQNTAREEQLRIHDAIAAKAKEEAAAERESAEALATTRKKLAELDQKRTERNKAAREHAKQAAAEEQQHQERTRSFLEETLQKQAEQARKLEELRRSDEAAMKAYEDRVRASVAAVIDPIMAKRVQMHQMNADLMESEARQLDQHLQGMAELNSRIASGMGNAIGSSLRALVTGQKAWDEVMKDLIRDIMIMIAKLAIMKAIESSMGFGFGGSLLAGVVSGFAEGGFVTGGQPGRDSVPAVLMPGEYVMSTDEVTGVRRFMGRMLGGGAQPRADGVPHMAAGGFVPSSGGGATPVVINMSVQVTALNPGSEHEQRRIAKGLLKPLVQLIRDGQADGLALARG